METMMNIAYHGDDKPTMETMMNIAYHGDDKPTMETMMSIAYHRNDDEHSLPWGTMMNIAYHGEGGGEREFGVDPNSRSGFRIRNMNFLKYVIAGYILVIRTSWSVIKQFPNLLYLNSSSELEA